IAEGEVDAYSAPELRERLDEARADQARPFVADLSRITFLDSTALGELIRAFKDDAASARSARVVLPEGRARRIFEITSLDRALPVAESRAVALRELREPD
ncbi:MAG: STAS domain-containing protein, partial [Actinobacteria bacterium]|nr:STAS domain-containing protein [Actinomycetota bacterium]